MIKKLVKGFMNFNDKLSFGLAARFPGLFGNLEQRYIDLENCIKTPGLKDLDVAELGGVDRPMLAPGDAHRFVGVDVDDQGGEAHNKYDLFYKQSVEEDFGYGRRYDLIYSMTLIEHVPNNKRTFDNIYWALKKGGETIHYFPSKNAIYALFIRIFGNDLQRKVIGAIWGKDKLSTIGYPAYFDHCSANEMETMLKDIGYEDVEVKCYYRANSYFSACTPIYVLVSFYENICRFFNLRSLATGLLVIAKR